MPRCWTTAGPGRRPVRSAGTWGGRWTRLSFWVPETRRADRHALRTRLG
ncbi:hypothetical protein [Streptomyces sp. 6N223]